MKPLTMIRRAGRNVASVVKRRPAILTTNILLTQKCVQNCLQCSIPLNASENPVISFENYRALVDRLDEYGTQVLTLSGGDPMLHPRLADCIRYAVGKNFARVHLLTTLYGSEKAVARTLDAVFETGISIGISFDGFGKEVDTIRGAKDVAQTVMRSMEMVRAENQKRRKPIQVGVNVVISRLNLHQVPDILAYLERFGWWTDVDIYRWQATNQREDERMKLVDSPELRRVLEIVKKSPVVFTPDWLIDGFPDYLSGKFEKYCPYLDSPSLGSKFFINPDGGVKVCIGDECGNLLRQTPEEFFASDGWARRLADFEECTGCWNTCYTTRSRALWKTNAKKWKSYWRIARNKQLAPDEPAERPFVD
ncbi:MAG TPA: radical SAM protein [Bacteroidota bacterium]|nr:radical SAM protein [Bacteroidota bacterium]